MSKSLKDVFISIVVVIVFFVFSNFLYLMRSNSYYDEVGAHLINSSQFTNSITGWIIIFLSLAFTSLAIAGATGTISEYILKKESAINAAMLIISFIALFIWFMGFIDILSLLFILIIIAICLILLEYKFSIFDSRE